MSRRAGSSGRGSELPEGKAMLGTFMVYLHSGR